MLEFACPQCSELVKAAEDQAGERIHCPKCHQTIRVPGEPAARPGDAGGEESWSVFDDDEKFIEESVNQAAGPGYRTRQDDQEALVDDDREAARREAEEEREAVADLLAGRKADDFAVGPGSTSDMTVEEKMAAEDRLRQRRDRDPQGEPKGWTRPAATEHEPIRLDDQPHEENSIAVRCRVCESVTMVGLNKAGTTVNCSDCGSPIEVPMVPEEPLAQPAPVISPEEREQRQKSKITDELFVEPMEESDHEYGLAPAAEDLLRPVQPVYDDPDAHQSAESEPGKRRGKPRDDDDEPDLETSPLFEEMQAEKITRFRRLPWGNHVFSILGDVGFLLRAAISVMAMMVGYTVFYFGQALIASDPTNRAYEFFAALLSIFAFPVIPIGFLTVCWLGQKVLNSTIVGEKQLPDLEGCGVIEWVSNCLFVGVGFAIGAIPGVLLGGLIWTQITEVQGIWAIFALGTMTAMALSPLIIISAMYNQSPFKISSEKISGSMRSRADAWKEFYWPALVLTAVTGGLWFLGMIGSWWIVLAMLVAIHLCLGLYFRMMGRLMGTILEKGSASRESS